ncbi:MAG TPA: organomercurial lyase [Candidatus Binatia bacterium]|nr:organomercurial lyase [Candidatus Binatia bacterium]
MPQNVPEFVFGADALKVRQFLYEHWCAHGTAPNLRTVHEATGLARERIVAAYRELDLGVMCVVDLDTQNANVLKAPPFSSYPTQAAVHLGGRFHCWAGCAMEALAIGRMPPFAGKELRIEGYCACCLAPVTLRTKDDRTLEQTPATLLIHVSLSPREWNTTNIVAMCDAMNWVHDREHAERWERKIGRRGVVFTLEQARKFVAGTAAARMWQYDRRPDSVHPQRIIDGIRALGVDVSGWGE